MLIKHYAAFVNRTDQFSKRVSQKEAIKIATLGLTSEIGSIVSAIKKETLREGGAISSPLAKAELSEELGDAQLMWHLLPDIEKDVNPDLIGRPVNIILSEIAWHLCAIASLYKLDIDDIAQANFEKSNARHKSDKPTPLYDEGFPKHEQLPRYFEIEFHSISKYISQMYWNGDKLGDPLKDQYFVGDGYRFHDVMHLANAAVLGWSPVLRDLMKRKRVSCPSTKQSEDGGRSAVVEELVVKYIHAEAVRRAKEFQGNICAEDRVLFPENREIPFSLIKKVRELTIGHEVYANKYWEWELAIIEGYVIVDLNERELRFEQIY